LNKHLQELIELSKLDKSIDDFTPIIEAAQKKLERRVAKRDEISARMEEVNTQIKDIKIKIASYEGQIVSLNEQLSLGAKKFKEVKSEKELQALQMEEELAKEKIRHANEEIDRQNSILEKKEATLVEISAELEVANEELEKVSAEVSAKMESIEEEKAKLFVQRENRIITIDQKILSFYEKIRIWANNSTVVPVRKQACYGCYMKLNDSAYAEVIKSEDICTCHHCGRILYIEPQTADSDA
jgi:predicted  nucleic acid-binding Zn-ribbon protein